MKLKSIIDLQPNEKVKNDIVFWNGFEKAYYPSKAKAQHCEATLKDLLERTKLRSVN